MPIDLTFNSAVVLDGQQYATQAAVQGDGVNKRDITLPAAKTGALSARTDDDTGTVAAQAGHGIVSTNRVDVYWAGGQRRGMIATVTGDNVAVDGGAGDNLPVLTTPVTIVVCTEEIFVLTGDNVSGLVVECDQIGAIVFAQAGGTLIFGIPVGSATPSGRAYVWFSGNGVTNPLAGGAVGKLFASQSTTGQTARMKVAALYT